MSPVDADPPELDAATYVRDVVLLVDERGRILDTSPTAFRVLGHDHLIGRSLDDLLDADGHVPASEALADRPDREGASGDVRVRGDARRWFAPAVTAHPAGRVVVLRDVTERRRIERHAELLRRVTETSNDTSATSEAVRRAIGDIRRTMRWDLAHVFSVGEDGRCVSTGWWDPAGSFADVVAATDELAPGSTAVASVAARTGEPAVAVGLDAGDGHPRTEAAVDAGLRSAVAVPVIAEAEPRLVLEFHSKAEIDLDDESIEVLVNIGRQLGSVLERELHLERLGEVSEELHRSNAELERFAYVASHDLQEPLRKIVGFSQLLRQRYGDELGDDADDYLDYLVDGAQRMQELIRDLLAYSRIGRSSLDLEEVALGDVVDDVIADLGWEIDEAGGEVVVDDLPTVVADPGQLSVLLRNLVSNALKYRGDEPPVVRVGADRADGGGWEVRVTDNGIGIEPGYREQVFEIFRRLHARTEYLGTGIGLAISKRIVERHGGRISIEDGDAGGTTFVFTIPDEIGDAT